MLAIYLSSSSTRLMKETCSGVSSQSFTYEKLGLCIRNRLNAGCIINDNLVLGIIEDLFLGLRQIHIKIGIAKVCTFLVFRLVVPDRSDRYKTGCLDSIPCDFNFVSFQYLLVPHQDLHCLTGTEATLSGSTLSFSVALL